MSEDTYAQNQDPNSGQEELNSSKFQYGPPAADPASDHETPGGNPVNESNDPVETNVEFSGPIGENPGDENVDGSDNA